MLESTPQEQVIGDFIEHLANGLSYQTLLAALLLAALDDGDPHQVAQVHAAHRVSSAVPVAARLPPTCWTIHRLAGIAQNGVKRKTRLTGDLPRSDQALEMLNTAMRERDGESAERAIVVLGRDIGARPAMSLLFRHGVRRVFGTFGHHPIMIANAYRTLDALDWLHAEPVLRYLAKSFASYDSDQSFEPNVDIVNQTTSKLPAGWGSMASDETATRELFHLIRAGDSEAGCEFASSRLAAGDVRAGTVWDAIRLAASDIIFRLKTGGNAIGGSLVHAVTSTNALRFCFSSCDDDRTRLLIVLQAIANLGSGFVGIHREDEELRDVCLLDLRADDSAFRTVDEIFETMPDKSNEDVARTESSRQASDLACRNGFALMRDENNAAEFLQKSRNLLCSKATTNPHDSSFPLRHLKNTMRWCRFHGQAIL